MRPTWDEDDELFLTDDEKRRYEMPIEGKNFKHDNKLVFQMLKSACIKSDAWAWIRLYDRAADGRKAWLALVQHYDGSGELSKRVERAKAELERLHYKDEKVFPFKKFIVTKLKENFNVLEKDKHEDLSGRQQVDLMTKAIRSSDARVLAGLVNVHQNFRFDFDEAANFMSGLILSIHSSAQLDYANRHGNKRRYVSAMGSNDQRGGRDRSRQGGRSGQRGGRDGRGRGRNNERRTYAKTSISLIPIETSRLKNGTDLVR